MQGQTQGEHSHVMTESKIGVMASSSQGMPRPTRNWKRQEGFGRTLTLITPWFWMSSLQNYDELEVSSH